MKVVLNDDMLPDLVRLLLSPGVRNIHSLTFHNNTWTERDGSWWGKNINIVAEVLKVITHIELPNLGCITLVVEPPHLDGVEPDWEVMFPSVLHSGFAVMQDALLHIRTLKTLVIYNRCTPSGTGEVVELPAIVSSLRVFYQKTFSALHADGRLQILPLEDMEIESSSDSEDTEEETSPEPL